MRTKIMLIVTMVLAVLALVAINRPAVLASNVLLTDIRTDTERVYTDIGSPGYDAASEYYRVRKPNEAHRIREVGEQLAINAVAEQLASNDRVSSCQNEWYWEDKKW